MADDPPTSHEHGAHPDGEAEEHAKPENDFGLEFEFDQTGMEAGLELDKSGFEPAPPDPVPMPEPAQQPVASASPPAPAPPRREPPPRADPRGSSGPSPKLVRVLALGAAMLVVVLLAWSLGGDSEPPTDPIPPQALEEGARAFHQGKWVDALKAFRRLRRFPTSPEAQEVRDKGFEAIAIKEIMEAEPSSTAIRRLEELAELYPDRVEVKTRLGDVRKALSSGARAKPDDADEEN